MPDRTIQADVVRAPPSFRLTDDGIATVIYSFESHCPFGPDLHLVNVSLGESVVLTDRATAELYFARAGEATNLDCPGMEGRGVEIL